MKTDKLPAEGEILAGKYRVERVLGAGGMGVVVAATHVQLNERVALKFLRADALEDVELVTRFLREARATSRLKGEHVARVRDVGSLDDGSPYIVMEYLDGTTFKGLVAESGPLLVADAVDYILQACEAIAEAHSVGIIHRDVKPANLFLARRPDRSPLVKVLDFGISKIEPWGSDNDDFGAMTSTATMLGSPLYMSPEQMTSSRTVDARTDQWSIAVTLFFLVTGKTPFAASTVPEICSKVLTMAPLRANQLNPDVPGHLAEVIDQCLQKDPERRFPDMSKLARALEPFGSEDARGSSARIARVIKASVPPPRSVRASQPDLEPPNAADSTTTRGVTSPLPMPTAPMPMPSAPMPLPLPPRKDRSALVYAGAGSVLTLAIVGVALGVVGMGSRSERASAGRPPEPSTRPAEMASMITTVVPPPDSVSPPASATPVVSAAPTTMSSAATKPKPARAPARTGDPGVGPGSYR